MITNPDTLNLKTIDESGKPPKSRLTDAYAVQDIVRKFDEADRERSRVRAKVKGLVDGNPPYDPAKLRAGGQSNRTNVNFREAEGFLSLALSAFYDVFSEVPHYATVSAEGAPPETREEWGNIVTEEFDKLQKADKNFDFNVQQSQHEMVLFGTGPVIFEDELDWRCRAIKHSELRVPDRSKANVTDWEIAAVHVDYQAHELFRFIDGKAAEKAGWKVQAVRAAIMSAAKSIPGQLDNWEWHQQQIRNNDLHYSAQASVIQVAHVYWKEFDGRITHSIVLRNQATEGGKQTEFLYLKVGRFAEWSQVICPMYYDKGDGSHHSVKGMGIKFYGALEIKNRLKCAVVDGGFARAQQMLQPATGADYQNLSVLQMGPYAVLPPNVTAVQTTQANTLEGPMAVERDLENSLQSNLSQYRQRIEKPEGNPRTAFEINAIMSQASSLGKTQLNRYYAQLDDFYAERYRRASNPKLTKATNKEAFEFQQRCVARGVPRELLPKMKAMATRTIGQGSPFLKQQVLESLLGIVALLPEGGRVRVLQDYIASRTGQSMVNRYYPTGGVSPAVEDQAALAVLEHSALKQGAPVMVTGTQNHAVHLQEHVKAATEALNSVPQGADAGSVLLFLIAVIAHAAEHLERMSADPTRKAAVTMFTQQLKQLSKLAEQLQQQVQQGAEQAAQQNGQMGEEAIEVERMRRDEARKDTKTVADLQRKQAKHVQQLAIADAKAAADLRQSADAPEPAE